MAPYFNSTASTSNTRDGQKFWEGLAYGTRVYFAPYNADVVGVFDCADHSFSTVRLTITLLCQ